MLLRSRPRARLVIAIKSGCRSAPLGRPKHDRPPAAIVYQDIGGTAPLVYFDIVAAYGTMHGAVEVELATRIAVPKPDGAIEAKFLSSGRLRCSATAATNLRNGLDAALKMLEQPQANAVAASKLN
jgi:hypothetical protein